MKSIFVVFFLFISIFGISPTYAVQHKVLISDPSIKNGKFEYVEYFNNNLYGFYSSVEHLLFFYGGLDSSLKIKSFPKGSQVLLPLNVRKPKDIYAENEIFYKNDGKVFAYNILTAKERELTGISAYFYYNRGQVVSFKDETFAVYDLNSGNHLSLQPLIQWQSPQKQIFLNLYYDFQNKQLISLGSEESDVYAGKTFQNFQLEMKFQKIARVYDSPWEEKISNNKSEFSWVKADRKNNKVVIQKYDFLKESLASKTLECSLKGYWGQTYKGTPLIECEDKNNSVFYDITGTKLIEFPARRESIIGFNENVVAEGFVLQYSANQGCTLWDRQMNKMGHWGGSNYVKNSFIKPIETISYGSDLYLGDYLLTYRQYDWSNQVRMWIYSSSLKKNIETTTDWGARYSLPNGSLLGFSDKIFEIVLDEEIFN